MMKTICRLMTVAALVAGGLSCAPALAGPYTDELSKCLVASTSPKDRTEVVRWLFSSTSVHPDVKSLCGITDEQRLQAVRNTAALFERLLTDSCRAQFREATRYEGNAAIEASFGVLGQVAMRTLMEDPEVAKAMAALGTELSEEKIQAALAPDAEAPATAPGTP